MQGFAPAGICSAVRLDNFPTLAPVRGPQPGSLHALIFIYLGVDPSPGSFEHKVGPTINHLLRFVIFHVFIPSLIWL